MSHEEQTQLRDEVREIFQHGYDSYMQYAFPKDELASVTCTGVDTWGAYALTLIDSLDTLVVMGNYSEFRKGVEYASTMSFDRDITVSVFETNIRILGGLLAAHFLAADAELNLVPGYDGSLLQKAIDVGERLLPAFNTPTGIPYGVVNLRHGVPRGETVITSTAGGGTFTVEFGVLSRLSGDPRFENAAKQATRALFARRSKLGLVGNHINIHTGEWTHKDAGVGASIDSYYEYFIKAYILLGDQEYLHMAKESYKAVQNHLRHDPWYVQVHMEYGGIVWPIFNALQAFWPGMEVLHGKLDSARRTLHAFFTVWRFLGVTPEGFNLVSSRPQQGQLGYPLRPELAESTYLLYQATHDPAYLAMGRDMVSSLQSLTRTKCGFAAVRDVHGHDLADKMDSYFLAETAKYLYLMFDSDNLVNREARYVFNTEGHLMDLWQVSHLRPSSPNRSPLLSSLERVCAVPTFSERLTTYGILFPGKTFRQSKPSKGTHKYKHRDPPWARAVTDGLGRRPRVFFQRYDPPTWIDPNHTDKDNSSSENSTGDDSTHDDTVEDEGSSDSGSGSTSTSTTSDGSDHGSGAPPRLNEAARAEYKAQQERLREQQQRAKQYQQAQKTKLKEQREKERRQREIKQAREIQAQRERTRRLKEADQQATSSAQGSTTTTTTTTTTTSPTSTTTTASSVGAGDAMPSVMASTDDIPVATGANDIQESKGKGKKKNTGKKKKKKAGLGFPAGIELGGMAGTGGTGTMTAQDLERMVEEWAAQGLSPQEMEAKLSQASNGYHAKMIEDMAKQFGLTAEQFVQLSQGGEIDPALAQKLYQRAEDIDFEQLSRQHVQQADLLARAQGMSLEEQLDMVAPQFGFNSEEVGALKKLIRGDSRNIDPVLLSRLREKAGEIDISTLLAGASAGVTFPSTAGHEEDDDDDDTLGKDEL